MGRSGVTVRLCRAEYQVRGAISEYCPHGDLTSRFTFGRISP
jgi:hypothetical protein